MHTNHVKSTIAKGGPPPIFVFFKGGLLRNSKSKIPTLPQGFCKVSTKPLFSDRL